VLGFCLLGFLAMAIAVTAQPHISQQPQSRSVLAGSRVAFTVEVISTTPISCQWRLNGQDIRGATRPVYRTTASASRAGVYSVVVRNATGETVSSGARLDVYNRPVFRAQPRSHIVGEHTVAEFAVVLNDSGPYTRMIWHNDNPIEGPHEIPPSTGYITDRPVLRMTNPLNDPTWNSWYWFAVTNPAAGRVSRKARLTVVSAPTLTVQPEHREVTAGATVVLRVRSVDDAGPPHTYQWFKDGKPIPGATRSSLTLRRIQPEHHGNYYCVVTGLGGSTSSWGAHVTVSAPPP
jgi:hypothetical protein